MHAQNCFITLTYDDEHCPLDGSLDHRHFQLFMKRLRKHANIPIKFYMCGEYGGKFGRPHYHAIIFGYDFSDKVLHSRSPSGELLYRSPTLERLWVSGFSTIGQVSFQSCAYVSRYIMTKLTGDAAIHGYDVVNLETGEITSRRPEYNRASNQGGIGKSWWLKYGKSDVAPHDRVVLDGVVSRPPRYYDVLLNRDNPLLLASHKKKRIDKAMQSTDNTIQRLRAREIVTEASISTLKRNLK